MKISAITVQDWQGVAAVDVVLGTPIALFAGANGSGKSSVREAVIACLTGEPTRVALKKEYRAMVRDGEKHASAGIAYSGGGASFILPGGDWHHSHDGDPVQLATVLDGQRFASLDAKERRRFLFDAMGVSLDPDHIKARMVDAGLDAALVAQVAPLLRGGFEVVEKEAQGMATGAKGAWRGVTGEIWGSKKADGWRPANVSGFDGLALDKAEAELARVRKSLEIAVQLAATYKAQHDAHNAVMFARGKATVLALGVNRLAGIVAKTQLDLTAERGVVAAAEAIQARTREPAMACPECGTLLDMHATGLVRAAPEGRGVTAADAEAIAGLPAHRDAVAMLERSLANHQRDLHAAEFAATEMKTPPPDAPVAPTTDVAALRRQVDAAQAERDRLHGLKERATANAAAADRAAAHHADVVAWSAIAQAMGPDGIPAQLLAEALDPLLSALPVTPDWPLVRIGKDMAVTAGGRDYRLLSESEKWRVDAAIAIALAEVTGLGVVVLDRFDVLDLPNRGRLLRMLHEITAPGGSIETALVFGTLKAMPDPANLPWSVTTFWLDHGRVTLTASAPA